MNNDLLQELDNWFPVEALADERETLVSVKFNGEGASN